MTIKTLDSAAPELLTQLKSTVRILEAVRYSAGLSGNQIDRLTQAKAVIAQCDQLPQAPKESRNV